MRIFDALPPYAGGKRRLAPLLLALIREQLNPRRFEDVVVLDPFSGGGAVALLAKALGARKVLASDEAERAAIVARALIANSGTRITYDDVLALFLPSQPAQPGRAARQAGRLLTIEQARFVDAALSSIDSRAEPKRSLLQLLMVKTVLGMFPMSTPAATDAAAAARGDFDRVSTRRTAHYARAQQPFTPDRLWRTAQSINAGVFAGQGVAIRGDARAVLRDVEADVAYLDPPYPGTTPYNQYRLLDEILGDDQPASASPSLDDLLIAAERIPLVVLSYGGPSVTLARVIGDVELHREVVQALEIPYPRMRSLAKEETNANSREFIIVARRRRTSRGGAAGEASSPPVKSKQDVGRVPGEAND